MSVLDVLDATNICARRPDSQAWAVNVPVPVRRLPSVEPATFSWWSLARNPRALALTGVVAAGLARDRLLRIPAST